jgi:hypothetical protein
MIKAHGTEIYYPFLSDIEYGFWGGYAEEDIHREMLADEPRKEAYRKTSINNCAGLVVLDVGTGSGAIAI